MNVNYSGITPYDTGKLPRRQPLLFTTILYLGSRICMLGKKYKIEKIGMRGLKPPYILLCNHMYFVDFYLNAIATFPHRVNNVATIDGYYRRPLLMELLGCICKRKFTNDMSLLRSIRHVLTVHKDVLCMYPEARYTPIGTTAPLPDSIGKLIKRSGVPVVVLLHHGNYLHTPFWDKDRPRKVPLYSTMTQILTAEDVAQKSADEIMAIVREAMTYDEYKWQKEQGLRITEPERARGIHKVLYQCPHCQAESRMDSRGHELFCTACGKVWELGELGELTAKEGETEFSHIPDWFEWERLQVRKQVEDGSYYFEDTVDVHSLPIAERFIHLGEARLTHTIEDGLVLEGFYNDKPYRVQRAPGGMYGLHVEYDYVYVKPEDCIDISTADDSFYCYPTKQNVITKLSFAVEEIYRHTRAQRKNRERGAL